MQRLFEISQDFETLFDQYCVTENHGRSRIYNNAARTYVLPIMFLAISGSSARTDSHKTKNAVQSYSKQKLTQPHYIVK